MLTLSKTFPKLINRDVALTREQASDNIGNKIDDPEHGLCRIIGVDPKPPKLTLGLYYVAVNDSNETCYLKVNP